MNYTNSPLVDYTKLSPMNSGQRNHCIDTVSIHCVVGQCSVETLGQLFQTKQASSNYGIGYDGRIGMYVEEEKRSWCTSSSSNDNRAITIEVASDTFEPYRVNEKAYNSLIRLLVDICKRNGIPKLLWRGDKSLIGQVDKQNMTVHRWFANKSCPGEYLYGKHGEIATAVNKQLGIANENVSGVSDALYRVQIGAFSNCKNAETYLDQARENGFDGFVVRGNDDLLRVQIGAFKSIKNAETYLDKATKNGFSGFVVQSKTAPAADIRAGAAVMLKPGAKAYDGGNLADFVYNRPHIITEIVGDRAVISYGNTVVAAVNIKDLAPA